MYREKDLNLVLIILFFILIFNSFIVEARTEAIIDLRGIDLTENLLNLDGEWEFYGQQLLEPNDFIKEKHILTGIVEVPGAWNSYEFQENIPSNGYATYRVLIKMEEKEEIIGLKIPRIFTAYKMWANDRLIASAGEIGKSREEMTPQYLPQIAFLAREAEVEIIIQIVNFYHRSGGILESISISSEKNIIAINNEKLAYDLFLFGSLLIMAIYHLIIFFYRKKEKSVLYFGIFCLFVSIRTLLVGEIFFTQLFPNFNWELAHKVQTLSFYLGVLVLLMFFKSVFPDYFKVKVLKIVAVVVTIFSLIVILTPARIFTFINPAYQIFTFIIIIYVVYNFYKILLNKVIREKDIFSFFIVLGAIGLIITVINDIFYLSIWRSDYHFLRKVIVAGNLSSLGFLFFVFADSLALALKYSNAFKRKREMSLQLKRLNENLELIVRERTKELRISNNKIQKQKEELEKINTTLQKLSQIDSLTKLRNRRYFDESLQIEWRRALRKKISLSLLFIDIDDFKAYNDYYGHRAGDKCLQKVAQEIKRSAKRAGEIVARYGGEEFVVLLPNIKSDNASKVAELIREKVEDLKILNKGSHIKKYITVSIGCATVVPNDSLFSKDLVLAADKAMYKAKQRGKNQIKIVEIT